jgi:hypothetical protein
LKEAQIVFERWRVEYKRGGRTRHSPTGRRRDGL